MQRITAGADREIRIRQYVASCDLCGTQFPGSPLPPLPDELQLAKFVDQWNGAGTYTQIYSLTPESTEATTRAAIDAAGWTAKMLHGKRLLICAKCSARPDFPRVQS